MRARLTQGAVITLMSTLLACGGHTPTGPSSPPAPTTFTLSGQVIDGATRLGILAARVSIVDGPDAGKWSMTDAFGNYRLGDLQEATFTVKAHAPHYVSQTKPVTLTGNQTLSFALVATASPPHPSARTTKTSLRQESWPPAIESFSVRLLAVGQDARNETAMRQPSDEKGRRRSSVADHRLDVIESEAQR